MLKKEFSSSLKNLLHTYKESFCLSAARVDHKSSSRTTWVTSLFYRIKMKLFITFLVHFDLREMIFVCLMAGSKVFSPGMPTPCYATNLHLHPCLTVLKKLINPMRIFSISHMWLDFLCPQSLFSNSNC